MGRLALFLGTLLPILISVMIAKHRRKGCVWNRDKANNQMIAAVLMILLSQLVIFTPAQPGSPLAIGSALLLWYGVYRLARAIYRRRDLARV